MISPKVQELLAQLQPSAEGLDILQVFEALYNTRFTGPVGFDFLNGRPRQINLGAPVKLAICAPEGVGGVDKRP